MGIRIIIIDIVCEGAKQHHNNEYLKWVKEFPSLSVYILLFTLSHNNGDNT